MEVFGYWFSKPIEHITIILFFLVGLVYVIYALYKEYETIKDHKTSEVHNHHFLIAVFYIILTIMIISCISRDVTEVDGIKYFIHEFKLNMILLLGIINYVFGYHVLKEVRLNAEKQN